MAVGGLLTSRWQPSLAQTQVAGPITIDLVTEPAKIDPATTYDADGWSIVHSIYDSLIQYGPNGEIEMLLAESWELIDRTDLSDRIAIGNRVSQWRTA